MFMDGRLSRYQFLSTCSIDSMKSQSKFKKLFCKYQQTDSKSYREAKGPE